jgi:metal-responsive CopG/Arc/MetJ family transcriptional regulator
MATMNFSVPDDLKEAFNEAFKDQNKSAIIADLMREAVERAERRQRSHQAIASILERRNRMAPVSEEASPSWTMRVRRG